MSQLLIQVRETDGSVSEHRQWTAPASFDLAQARHFSRWQRAVVRSGRQIVSIAGAA